jgi:hypothetical protein
VERPPVFRALGIENWLKLVIGTCVTRIQRLKKKTGKALWKMSSAKNRIVKT